MYAEDKAAGASRHRAHRMFAVLADAELSALGYRSQGRR